MKKILALTILVILAIAISAEQTPEESIVQAANRVKELAIQAKAVQQPEDFTEILAELKKEIIIVFEANAQLSLTDDAQKQELADAFETLFKSIEVIALTATQYKDDEGVRKALEDFEAELEKLK